MKPDSYALARRVASVILLLWLAACAHTEFHTQACLSGVDVYEDATYGSDASRMTFSGTDGGLVEPCQGVSGSLGGFWIASLERTGPVGRAQDATVETIVLGGEWTWWQADGTLQSGSVTGGRVIWPVDLHQSIRGCGEGVAQVSVTLSVSQKYPGSGTFEGCLDDTHLAPTLQWIVYPPKMWGTFTISSP